MVNVTGSGDTLKVNDAKVICGGVKTANATVYLIDTVLSPDGVARSPRPAGPERRHPGPAGPTRLSSRPRSPTAEAPGLGPGQCRFNSCRGHWAPGAGRRGVGGSDPSALRSLATWPVAFTLYFAELDLALGVDDDRRPDDAGHLLAVQRLLAPRAPRLQNLALGVRGQREGQVLALDELRQRPGSSGETPRRCNRRPAASQVVPEVAGLGGAAGGLGARVEVDDTCRPRRSDSRTLPPSAVCSVKSGASSPASSLGTGTSWSRSDTSQSRSPPGRGTCRARALWTAGGGAAPVDGRPPPPGDRARSPGRVPCPTFARMGADQRAGGESLPEDPEALEKIIDDRRRHLAQTVDELVVRAHPKEIARRSAEDARQRAVGFAVDEQGQVRYERVAAAATALVLLVVVVVVRRRGRS